DAVAVLRGNAFRVYILRQREYAPEVPVESLASVVLRLLIFRLHPATSGHREQVLLYRKIESLGVELGGEQVDVHPLRSRSDIQRRKGSALHRAYPGRPGRLAEELIHLALQTSKFVEEAIGIEIEQTFEHGNLPWAYTLMTRKVGSAETISRGRITGRPIRLTFAARPCRGLIGTPRDSPPERSPGGRRAPRCSASAGGSVSIEG